LKKILNKNMSKLIESVQEDGKEESKE